MKYHIQVMLACLLGAVMVLAPVSVYAAARSARSSVSHHSARTYHDRTPRAHVRHAHTRRA